MRVGWQANGVPGPGPFVFVPPAHRHRPAHPSSSASASQILDGQIRRHEEGDMVLKMQEENSALRCDHVSSSFLTPQQQSVTTLT